MHKETHAGVGAAHDYYEKAAADRACYDRAHNADYVGRGRDGKIQKDEGMVYKVVAEKRKPSLDEHAYKQTRHDKGHGVYRQKRPENDREKVGNGNYQHDDKQLLGAVHSVGVPYVHVVFHSVKHKEKNAACHKKPVKIAECISQPFLADTAFHESEDKGQTE